MPFFIASVFVGLRNFAGTVASQLLVGLGICVITFGVVLASVDFLISGLGFFEFGPFCWLGESVDACYLFLCSYHC